MVQASMTSERRGGHPQEAVVTPIGQCLTAATLRSPRFSVPRTRQHGHQSLAGLIKRE